MSDFFHTKYYLFPKFISHSYPNIQVLPKPYARNYFWREIRWVTTYSLVLTRQLKINTSVPLLVITLTTTLISLCYGISSVLNVRSSMASFLDTDHYVVVENFQESLVEIKRTAQKFDVNIINFSKLNELKVRKQNQVKVWNRFAAL